MKSFLSPVFAIVFIVGFGYAIDQTRQPNAYGHDVVEAVVNLIRESCLFADDRRFLRRLAYVESQDGMAPNTFRRGYYGGIWQVDENEFLSTQNKPELQHQYDIIRDVMHINWNSVSWYNLNRPLYSGIAAALFTILNKHGDLSWKAEEQGNFWANNFHGTTGSASNFTVLANLLDLGCHTNQEVDIVFVLDTSSSLSNNDFIRSKRFISQVADGFPISPTKTQVAVVTYSKIARIEFFLNNYSNIADLDNAIDHLVNHPGSTATDEGIDRAVNEVFSTAHGARPNAVKVMVVITDGNSDDVLNTADAAARAHNSGIVTFSVGVGSHIGGTELNSIASDPDCTHAYTVSNYEEIRFMKEEIQKATCIAPLFINTTYSCVLNKCPPLAVLTGLTGTTVETNITCGGMNVYGSLNNPYPSSAQYETMLTTFAHQPSIHYYNVSGKTLYMNFQDFNQSANCVATITPYPGDRTEKPLTIKCFRGAIEVPCNDSYFNCSENWNVGHPCTQANILAGKTKFPHPFESNKFLMCDLSGKMYIVVCPRGEIYFADCSQCLGENTTVSTGCSTPAPSGVGNCSRENILNNLMYFPYPNDPHKYIHCDVWGHPWVRSCPPGENWHQDIETCVVDGYNPCLYHIPGTPFLYPHGCDPHRYIQCDDHHQSFVQSCQHDWYFLQSSQTCVVPGTYNTGNYRNTCPGATTTPYYATTQPVITGTGSGSITGYEFSSTVYAAPCTKDNIARNELFFPYRWDNHHYIQCNNWGNMYLRDCAPGFYDPYSHTCVDGPVFVDNQLVGK